MSINCESVMEISMENLQVQLHDALKIEAYQV